MEDESKSVVSSLGASLKKGRLLLWQVGCFLGVFLGGFICATLGGFLSFWTPLWFPSGLALVALLCLGGRVWPAVTLGSFCGYAYLLRHQGGSGEVIPAALFGAAGIVSGGWVSAGLIRRWVGWPDPLDKLRKLSLFMVGGVLVGPVVAATVTVLGWSVLGKVHAEMRIFVWIAHFLAQAAGVSMLAPLLLICSGQVPEVWKKRRWLVARAMAISLVAGGSLLAYVSQLEVRQMQGNLDEAALRLFAAIEQQVAAQEEGLESVRGLFESSAAVTRNEFKSFTKRTLNRLKGFVFLAWSPETSEGGLPDLIHEAKKEALQLSTGDPVRGLLENFQSHPLPVTTEGHDGPEKGSHADVLPFRYPLFFIEPLIPNAEWIGSDLADNPLLLKAIQANRQTGTLWISPPLRDQKSGEIRLLMGLPVQSLPGVTDRLPLRCPPGLVIGAIDAKQLFGALSNLLDSSPILSLQVRDLDDRSSTDPIYQSRPVARNSPPPGMLRQMNEMIEIGGRRWAFEFSPDVEHLLDRLPWRVAGVQVAVLMVTSLFGALLLLGTGFTFRVEEEVVARTEELRMSQNRFRQMAEYIREVFWIRSADGQNFEYVSPASEEIWGQRSEVLCENPGRLIDSVVPEDRPRFLGALHPPPAKREIDEEYRILDEKNRVRWIRDRAFPVLDETGNVIRWTGVADDVTDQKALHSTLLEARAAAEEAGRALGQFFDMSLDMICIAGTDGFFKKVNPAFSRTLGYEEDLLLGKPFFEWIHPDDLDKTYQAVANLKGAIVVVSFENRYRHRNGHYLWLEWNATADQEGEQIFAVARNVTQRKALEEDLRRSNAELEQFAYIASHDLREPLRMVTSFVQLLKKRYEGKLGADADEYIGHAVDGVERMRRMIEGLLKLSRIERRGNQMEKVNLMVPVGQALQNLSLTIKDKSAVIEVPKEFPDVYADADQLTLLFQNLFENALKFVKNRQPEVRVTIKPLGNFWEVSVSDNGPGIPPDQEERIFQIFQRLDQNEKDEGCGIGLALCRRVVERHGGSICGINEPGKGSIFRFILPAFLSNVEKGGKLGGSEQQI